MVGGSCQNTVRTIGWQRSRGLKSGCQSVDFGDSVVSDLPDFSCIPSVGPFQFSPLNYR